MQRRLPELSSLLGRQRPTSREADIEVAGLSYGLLGGPGAADNPAVDSPVADLNLETRLHGID